MYFWVVRVVVDVEGLAIGSWRPGCRLCCERTMMRVGVYKYTLNLLFSF